jgi:membrane-associated phospholipid phosphatase
MVGAFLEVMLYRSVLYTGFESGIDPHVMPPICTRMLQDLLGTEGFIATVSSYFYIYGHFCALLLLGVVIFFSKNQRTNMLAVVLSFAMESLIFLIFPLAPPVRTEAAVPIRLLIFPSSDAMVSIKYSAFPSGHIIKSVLGYIICKRENFVNLSYIYAINTALVSFVILYLGEHYAVDILGGILFAVIGFAAARYIIKNYLGEVHPIRDHRMATA